MANYPYAQPYSGGYNTISPYQQPVQTQQNGYICRPVTCREEAVAAQVDYFSAGLVMPDFARGVIYVKRFNSNTGASDFGEFKYSPPQPETTGGVDTSQFVTRKEFEEFTRRLAAVKEAEIDAVS